MQSCAQNWYPPTWAVRFACEGALLATGRALCRMHHWEGEEQHLMSLGSTISMLQGSWPSLGPAGDLMTCLSTGSVLYEFLDLQAEGSTSCRLLLQLYAL